MCMLESLCAGFYICPLDQVIFIEILYTYIYIYIFILFFPWSELPIIEKDGLKSSTILVDLFIFFLNFVNVYFTYMMLLLFAFPFNVCKIIFYCFLVILTISNKLLGLTLHFSEFSLFYTQVIIFYAFFSTMFAVVSYSISWRLFFFST